jgi:FemAB-related protein (PEP-CTERM system-associated)
MDAQAVALAPAPPLPALSVRPYRASDAARWETFVERCPNATFFHRIGWREVIEQEFRHRPHYLIAQRGEDVVGVLPLAEMRSPLFGHSLVSLPFCVYGGPAADDAEAAQALIDAAEATGNALGVDHVEMRNRIPLCGDWPRNDLYVTFRRTLVPDVEANLLAIPRKQRAMVRKGAKHGLGSEIDADARRFFALYADNVHRHGTPPLSRRYFERLIATFGDACEVQVVVDARGVPVSGVLSFYFRDEVLPYYAGDTVHARELAANDFKY